ncbi:hypothetical protein B0A49_03686 [Cryomyces minteri]|uniref:Chromate transport protein n=1 Tax=Cryomyces minteri TaxID=331657 RepID=A0A4V6WL92_9PEZI|nr:hypothetical protein B0A49_03686 [Cryomyces minteri]
MVATEWYLGFTSFGGPAVHFQIFYKMFVQDLKWIEEQTYQEMFALCQALPGPGSTKMIYAINIIRSGFTVGILSFFLWSLPGAIAAYGLAVGISRIRETLPSPVYALLSGLNSATVGIIALAAVQLSNKAITDKLARIMVFFGGTAGMLYNALWYYPVLMVVGGITTIAWDLHWIPHNMHTFKRVFFRRPEQNPNVEEGSSEPTELSDMAAKDATATATPTTTTQRQAGTVTQANIASGTPETTAAPLTSPAEARSTAGGRVFSWKLGLSIILLFLGTFTTIMVLRGTLTRPPFAFQLFANLYLAGTIIFGGGPVVIPLLREYVVSETWVSPRDFLLGLAIIQAFPGPNFNFAVYLGALATHGAGHAAALGAFLGYLAIFAPGIALHSGTMGLWGLLRKHRAVAAALRGINATAVGLIYAAVYRLWQQGFLSPDFRNGASLGVDPWWLVAAATSFVGCKSFAVPPPVAIVLGGAMGMVWYGVVAS